MAYSKLELKNNTLAAIQLTDRGFHFELPASTKVDVTSLVFLEQIQGSTQLNDITVGLLRNPVGTEAVTLYVDTVAVLPANLTSEFTGKEYYSKDDFISAFSGVGKFPVTTDPATGKIAGGLVDASAFNHNSLGSIDGGTTGQYYHTTSAQHTSLVNTLLSGTTADATTLHGHAHNDILNVNSGTYRHLSSSQVSTLTGGSTADSMHTHTWGSGISGIPGSFTPSSHALAVSSGFHSGTLPWGDLNKTGSNLTDLATRQHAGLTNIDYATGGGTFHVNTTEADALRANTNLSSTNKVIGNTELNVRILTPVATKAAVSLITQNSDNQVVFCKENRFFYEYDSTSVQTLNDPLVLAHQSGTGRWFMAPYAPNIDHVWLANPQGGTTGQYFHFSSAEHDILIATHAYGVTNPSFIKATPVAADIILIEDSASTWAKKSITVGSIGSGTYAPLSHVHAAGDITSGLLATARGGTNWNSSASSGVVKVQSGTWQASGIITSDFDIGAGTFDTDGTLAANSDTKIASQKATKTYGDTAIHKAVANEISAMTLKSPILVAADMFVIEDSAATNAKKKTTMGDIITSHHNSTTGSSDAVGAGTTSTTMQNKLAVSFTPAFTATYILHWSAELSCASNGSGDGVRIQVREGGTPAAPTTRYAGGTDTSFRLSVVNNYLPVSGIVLLSLTASTAYSFNIDYCSVSGGAGQTAYCRNARIFIRKVN